MEWRSQRDVGNEEDKMILNEILTRKIEYIRKNPVQSEYVEEPECRSYFSYVLNRGNVHDYQSKEGLLDE